MILLDTSVLSVVLRRRKKGEAEQELATQVETLLQGDRAIALPGIVLQEILSGIADQRPRDKILHAIRQSFPLLLASEGDHLKAADLASAAARKGIALSTPDALIAAQALNRRATLFTRDADFLPLAALAGLQLLRSRRPAATPRRPSGVGGTSSRAGRRGWSCRSRR